MRVVLLKINSNVYLLKTLILIIYLLNTTIIPLYNGKISLIFSEWRCKVCKCLKARIKNKKNFSEKWASPPTKYFEKESKKAFIDHPSQESN